MDLSFAQWTRTTTKLGEDGSTVRTTYYIRFDPPSWAWRDEYNGGWSHNVFDERGHLQTNSSWAYCVHTPHLLLLILIIYSICSYLPKYPSQSEFQRRPFKQFAFARFSSNFAAFYITSGKLSTIIFASSIRSGLTQRLKCRFARKSESGIW